MAQSESILSNQTHVGDSSVQTHTSTNFKGDGYYGRSDGFKEQLTYKQHLQLLLVQTIGLLLQELT